MPEIETIKKCRKCKSDILIGQKYCMECGQKQDVPIRTEEEILGMVERVKKAMKEEGVEFAGLMTCMTATFVLSWCLGNSGDEEFLSFLKMKKGK